MFDKIIEFGKQIFTLTRDVNQCKEELKEKRQHDKDQDKRIDEIAVNVQSLMFELLRDREKAASERENLLLRLENTLLRNERALPPGLTQKDEEIAELRRQNEALQREIAELNK